MDERPEFLPEKYWDPEGNNAPEIVLERVAKGYNELSHLIGEKDSAVEQRVLDKIEAQRKEQLPATPEDYPLEFGDLGLPEGKTFEMPPDDELLSEFRTIAHETGLKPDVANRLLNLYGRAVLSTMPDEEAEKKALGENYEARLERVNGILAKNLPKDVYESVADAPMSAAQFRAMEELANKVSGASGSQTEQFGDTSGDSGREALETELQGLMNDPRYWRQSPGSEHIRARVTKLHEQLHGTKPYERSSG